MDGHTVDPAENGETAWRRIQTAAYDCVLLDLVMPGMSGRQLHQLIEKSYPDLAKRIILMTGLAANPEVRDFAEAAAIPILGKPFNLDELRRVVHEPRKPTQDEG